MTPKFAGDYRGPRTTLLGWEEQFFQLNTQFPEALGTPAERRFEIAAHLRSVRNKRLFEPCRDIFDEAINSDDVEKMYAARNWIWLRQRFFALLLENGWGLAQTLDYEIAANLIYQRRLNDKLDGVEGTWRN